MILSRSEILKAIKKGKLKITPFEPSLVGPCSIDFRLGSDFKRIKKRKPLAVKNDLFYTDDFHQKVKVKEGQALEIAPSELVLGATLERFKLGKGVCGWVQGRSKIARLGLLVHVSSSFIQPGSNNHQVLEIVNMSSQVMYLHPGAVVGQIVFQEVKGSAVYSGIFQRQKGP